MPHPSSPGRRGKAASGKYRRPINIAAALGMTVTQNIIGQYTP
ncbi:Putative uncharacterized protein [Thermobacillus xylanilyticus]|uniref:Uncharacterized protein n=1 Tax=Thermobacillus xylanilyticus TaxID=76633 RepID=A0ABN7RX86_THEXY|nr:Putative uncharacterized protein [Thermobacillus xylanilyticus]